ncbi:SDR family NAD(P)-dependent oxidoreductase [Micromonospora andamanensis]|uniref:Acetoin dehydrogenase n=1 Tax=Micromonospora andamanensis TaxID=1287068 RepID=A0ABQ4I433_9ACTN|nr:SDR family oxidoreductase [Micromonospora andamanensis]GIJ12658.1 acetoin dehydrogenase [Micromonospora andamanensis]
MRRFTVTDGVAVVTGAAGGIGAALAHGLARRGAVLVLVDRDASGLAAVAAAIRAAHPGRQVWTHQVDLADASATAALAARIIERHPRIRLLVNNAGVALGGRFGEVTLEEFSWVVDVNFRAVAQLTHALLPALRAEPGAHLVTISSLFGLVAPPGQVAYAASKFAVRGFTEALRHELATEGIGVTCVHPGGVRTRIARDARVGSGVDLVEYEAGRQRFERLLTIDPTVAAETILRGVARRRGRVLVGWSARLLDLLARIAPVGHGRLLIAAGSRAGTRRPTAERARTPVSGPRSGADPSSRR